MSGTKTKAFTRLELVAVLVALMLLATLSLPLLAQHRGLSERAVCANNLRVIGMAYQSWGSDHSGYRPFQVPVADGGTLPSGAKAGNAWLELAMFNTHLAVPTVFACPSDANVRTAWRWSTTPDGGFYNPRYQNNALSYFVGLDANPSFRDSILGGDRDLRVVSPAGTCSATRINNASVMDQRGAPVQAVAWTNALHKASGNILFNDGRVATLSSRELRVTATRTLNDEGQCHILVPR